jgi:hypothetical protein
MVGKFWMWEEVSPPFLYFLTCSPRLYKNLLQFIRIELGMMSNDTEKHSQTFYSISMI